MAGELSNAVEAVLAQELSTPLASGLYLVSTPIGNLADITLRALCVLSRADHVYCEDTRHTQKLTGRYNLSVRLSAYHDHNAARERPKILKMLADGASVALVSDAGTPLVSDPGYKLVREAAGQGSAVISIPGPSAVLAGLASSGLPTDSFFFAGFLPPREVASAKRLEELSQIPATIILFETAARLDRTLAALGEKLPGRDLVIARELTKRFEEIIRVKLPVSGLPDKPWKGELVLLLGPPVEEAPDEERIAEAVREALKTATLRDAVENVRRTLRVPRKQVYELALQYQRDTQADHDD